MLCRAQRLSLHPAPVPSESDLSHDNRFTMSAVNGLLRLLACSRMRGLDATAARSLGTLASSLGIMGVQMLVTHLEPDTETARLLVGANLLATA